jgi:diacylglycerol kinase
VKRLRKSFHYAFEGLGYVIKTQPNMRIHSVMALIAIALGFIFHVSHAEWLALVLVIGFVMILEVINTAVETLVDLYTEEFNHLAKIAKDTAAAAVLCMAIVSVIVGVIIFAPKVLALF